jgi:hypothetical protein
MWATEKRYNSLFPFLNSPKSVAEGLSVKLKKKSERTKFRDLAARRHFLAQFNSEAVGHYV